MADDEEAGECTLCLEALPASRLSACPNDTIDSIHTICVACARELVRPATCGLTL